MKSYIEGHRNCGIKVGDKVRVTRKAEDYEGGWGDTWFADFMDSFVGETIEVQEDMGDYGFYCGRGKFFETFTFPYFVLEKI